MIAFAEPFADAAPVAIGAAPARARTAARFTLDGDDELERHLAHTCDRVLSGIRGLIPARKLEAVLLGGGYGRGEGGVLRTLAGHRAYNDLEFYVAIAGNRHVNEFLYDHRLHVLGEILTHLAGVDVEFKITSRAELAHRPVSMFSYDLVAAHRLIWSATGADLDGCDHHRHAENIPLEEAARLLMNRCSGLLFARRQLAQAPHGPDTTDFVRRNIAKAQLAMGDAVLTAHGLYHWSCRERYHRVKRLGDGDASPWLAELVHHHAHGVAFKLHPAIHATTPAILAESLDEVTTFALQCWLWLESRRLGRPFASARAYALDDAENFPGSSRLRNVALNLRVDGWHLGLQSRPWQHPRQRIFRALALLLWEPGALSEPGLRRRLEGELGSQVSSFAGAVDAYETFWPRVR